MQAPTHIGKYELLEYLGGGMSRVYRARDTVIGRTVAVKVLTEQGCADADTKARFLQEARVAGNITHDNIINIYDFGEDDQGHPFMVMEFIRGDDLRHLIRDGRTGSLVSKLKIALQVGRALEHIHSLDIIHRDIKPDNIVLTASGVVKLMDFGIAKARDAQLTRAGFTLGTPYYMAPEQVRGQPPTPLIDIYAYGILLFELLTGVRPIEGDTIETIFFQILAQPIDYTPLKKADIPEPLARLVACCVAKDPAERPPSFTLVCAELERILAGMGVEPAVASAETVAAPVAAPTVATPAGRPAVATPPAIQPPAIQPPGPVQPRSFRMVGAALGAVAVLLGLAAFLYFRSGEAQPALAPLEPVIHTTTGEMVLVPEGPFLSGPDKTEVAVAAFYIDRTEVTNAHYAHFCAERRRPLPPGFSADRPNHPVTNITYVDALEFANWAGKRLPELVEWEKAARGQDGRLFPWGNERDPRRANVQDNPDRTSLDLALAGSFTDGASPYRVLNLVGNAWEYIDEVRTPSPERLQAFSKLLDPPPTAEEPWYIIRGGSYTEPLSDNLVWDSAIVPARYRNVNLGFRCVKDPS